MITGHVHPRLGLPKFLAFEPYFLEALEAFAVGKETQIKISGGLSVATIAARMRDSLMGFRLNKNLWGTAVNPRFIELMAKYDGQFVIAGPTMEGEVWFRARHKKGGNRTGTQFHEVEGELGKYITTKSFIGGGAKQGIDRLVSMSVEDQAVEAFVCLKVLGAIQLPIIFPGPLDANLCIDLTSKNDVAFQFDEQRNETILL